MFGLAHHVMLYQERRLKFLIERGCPKLLAYGLVMTEWSRD